MISLLFLPGQFAAGPLFRQLPPLGQYRQSSSCLGRAGEMLSMVECGSDGSMSFGVDAGMRERAETTMEETTSESQALEVRRSLGERKFLLKRELPFGEQRNKSLEISSHFLQTRVNTWK